MSKVEEYLPTLLQEKIPIHIVVLDPPRQGLESAVIEAIMKLQPDLIIYVSCNPVTLARDLRQILVNSAKELSDQSYNGKIKNDCLKDQSGYKVEKIIPVDLFPQTYHIESITVLKRQ